MPHGYETEESQKEHILALLEERAGLEAKEDAEGVKAVDEQLKLYGHKASAPRDRSEKRPAEARVSDKRESR